MGQVLMSGIVPKLTVPTTGLPLYNLIEGTKIVHNSQYYTIIAKDYVANGDVVLWEDKSNLSSDNVNAKKNYDTVQTETPFGTDFTNLAVIKYAADDNSATVEVSCTGYGWAPPVRALGYNINYGSPSMSYFTSDAQRKRATAYCFADIQYKSSADSYMFYATTAGTITRKSYVNNSTSYAVYYAYSVKGELRVDPEPNADGSFNLIV